MVAGFKLTSFVIYHDYLDSSIVTLTTCLDNKIALTCQG